MHETPAHQRGEVTAFAPGRVNLIGEHTDYNDGLALPFAVAEGVTVDAGPLPEPRIEAEAVDFEESDSFAIDDPGRSDGWRAYVRGAVAELARVGLRPSGCHLRITGSVARGAGLSSSAALEVALTLALIAATGATAPDRAELAKLCSRIENDWVGAQTGLLDQLASLYGEEGHALRIDFRSLEVRPVRLELEDHRLVTLASGEEHTNAASGYNQRRSECAKAAELLEIPSLRDATPEMAAQLPDPLDRRVRHVIGANARVDATIKALSARDFAEVGRMLDQAHASLRDNYEVSTPAVEAAVEELKRAGALGARIMGGGFGGHVLGLFPPGRSAPAAAHPVSPGPGARVAPGGHNDGP